MNFLQRVQGLFQSTNYNMDPAQNPYFDPYNNTPGYYQGNGDTFHENPLQWNGQPQMIPNYQLSDTNENYHNVSFDQFQFLGENYYTSFDENDQGSNHKRALEYYDDDDMNFVPNAAKRQRLSEPSIQYAMKKSSDYANPMRKALDLLFESEITADGWEKIDNRIKYHISIRGVTYYQWGSSVEITKESAAETALKSLAGFKLQQISWPPQLLPFRLEQPFADSIEILVRSKFNELMRNNVQYKAHKVLSGIVMTNGMSVNDATVVAVGTGTKCFADKLKDKNGRVLHDMHAEVLVRRSFVRFLYRELLSMLEMKPSIFVLSGKEIQLKAEVKFHLYVNTIPCGDARVFSLKGCAQLKKMARQGTLRTKKIGGTDNLSETNAQRIKSMSCSDKMARWNILGLQGAALSKYIKPIYLESIVLGSSYVPFHLHRAMFGRLEKSPVANLNSTDGYRLNTPKFESTFVMEISNFASCEDYGVCWSMGRGAEIIDLNTGLKKNGKASQVSRSAFRYMFHDIDEKLTDWSAEGIEKYNEVKKMFYDALKAQNFGAWDTKLN
ncbi:double-stranded RNA-specific editase Adar-like [Bradysia coprophila]|uniref:double-stranded RNA-specific editase Adar-like n=1 Tax=Bradysia coprophila TaxID=38358 RepID=UPI00187D7E48|nr:double-stranded RNA-specific editase Adar-like [Bradysia coprophila]